MMVAEMDDWKVALKDVCLVVCLVGVLAATTVSTLVEQMDVLKVEMKDVDLVVMLADERDDLKAEKRDVR